MRPVPYCTLDGSIDWTRTKRLEKIGGICLALGLTFFFSSGERETICMVQLIACTRPRGCACGVVCSLFLLMTVGNSIGLAPRCVSSLVSWLRTRREISMRWPHFPNKLQASVQTRWESGLTTIIGGGRGGVAKRGGAEKNRRASKICTITLYCDYHPTQLQINRRNGSPETRRLSRLEQVPTSRTYILHAAVGIPGTELYSFPDSLADNSAGLCPYSAR